MEKESELIARARVSRPVCGFIAGEDRSSAVMNPNYYLGSIKARFMQGVYPGDQLRLEVETVKLMPTGAFASAKAFVGDKQVAEADLVFAVKR